ncbi:MAG: hypothetical protein Kow0081_0490 [Candidatus Dojkabacteria bacterium]
MKLECKILNDNKIWEEIYSQSIENFTDYPRTTFIQSNEWIKFQQSLGKNVFPIALFEDNKIVGFGAGVEILAKRGKYLYFRHGPFLNWENSGHVDNFFSFIKKLARERGLWLVRVSPLLFDNELNKTILRSFPKFPMSDVEGMDTWVMDIQDDEDKLFKYIKKKVRYEIRRAEKKGVEIEVTNNVANISDFYKILINTVERKKWNSYSEEFIRKEFLAFAEQGKANIVLAKYEGKYIAGGIFINDNIQTYYHYGASLTEFQKVPAMYLVIWAAIKLAKSNNSKFFNFWGICPENASPKHPWYGLSRFKMKFPGEAVRWASARDIPISFKYWLTNLYERIDKIRKGY